ncbi:MAG: hypothetical protein J6U83_04980 [Bacteroidales bacterium]|nr:hypothetical protein [Bacteroidales bacterium]MBO7269093.1 hypothetical protein [Bacteroidales bacterium]
MGRNDKDKWLGKLKDSVENHSEPLPDGFWEDIKRDIPSPAHFVQRRKFPESLVWAMAAAAVVLLGLVLFLPEKEDVPTIQTSLAEHHKVEIQDTVLTVLQKKAVVASIAADADAPIQTNEEIMEQTLLQVVRIAEKIDMPEDAENGMAVKSGQYRSAEQVQPDNGAIQLGQEKNAVQVVQVNDGEHKGQEKKVEVVKRDREAEREEYLKELEYLWEEADKRRGVGKKMMAFALGNGGVELVNPLELFAADKYGENLESLDQALFPDINMGGDDTPSANPDIDFGGTAGNAAPENFATLINMGGQPVENVTWLGGKSPAVFNSAVTYKNYSYKHKEPVKLGLSFAVELGRGFYVESGISYQYMESEMETGGLENTLQKLHYLGIPVKLGVNFMREKRFQVYLSGGYLVEKCVYGVLELPDGKDLGLKLPGVLNSMNLTAGLQVKVGDFTALYIEPGMYRYLGIGDEIGRDHGYILKNIYSKEPAGFSFQGGLRFLF